jgi:hypothetical protein
MFDDKIMDYNEHPEDIARYIQCYQSVEGQREPLTITSSGQIPKQRPPAYAPSPSAPPYAPSAPPYAEPQHAQPQGYQPQGYQPQGYQPQGHQPQGFQPQGYQPQGYQPQGYQPQQQQQQHSGAFTTDPFRNNNMQVHPTKTTRNGESLTHCCHGCSVTPTETGAIATGVCWAVICTSWCVTDTCVVM